MNLTMMKCKIHRATVTHADLSYEGSISICPDLIKKAGLLIHEQVDIYNCNNGARFTTYVIQGQRGEICLNGAAARHVQQGDLVIIVAYCSMSQQQAEKHVPRVVFVDHKNKSQETRIELARNNKKR
jgi:aspartate 1-decarboxylase